jgi:D-glycero-alpha-D-manno-heptose-7-phosphate kinase
VGGGSDIRDFYTKNGYGAVVSSTIRKYMYIIIHPYFHDKIRIKYSKTEDVKDIDEIEHPIVRECIKKVQIGRGIEIASFADVPAGTGLGSSSAFTVGLLNALYAYKGKIVSKEKLAAEACEIEIDILGEPIGKQDQYASAYGNINYIRFNSDETVDVCPIYLADSSRREIENHLCLYYLGGNRKSSDILYEQKKNICQEEGFQNLKKIVMLAEELKDILQEGNINLMGDLLHREWLLKKKLAPRISNEIIDKFYEEALNNGALGGKVLGAGESGFMLLYAKDHRILEKILGCRMLPFGLDKEGTKIIFLE